MEAIEDLASFIRNIMHIRKNGGLRDEILACQHKKGNAYNPFAVNVAIATCHHFLGFLICSTNLLMALHSVWRSRYVLCGRFYLLVGLNFTVSTTSK